MDIVQIRLNWWWVGVKTKKKSTTKPPTTPLETGESGDKEFHLSNRPQASSDLSFLRCVSLSLVGSLSLPLNLTSGFVGLSLVGRGVWVFGDVGSLPVVGVGVWIRIEIVVGRGAGQQCHIWPFWPLHVPTQIWR